MSRTPSRAPARQPKFAKDQPVYCSDADAREYRGVVLWHYAGRAGLWYAVGIAEIDGTLHFPEHRMRAAPAADPAADPASSGRAAEAEAEARE